MKALVLTEFGRLDVEERASPVPGPGEVLLKVVATGICGSDVHGFTGENGRRVPGQVMGHESVGRIQALGPEVGSSLFPGQAATFNPVVIPATDRSRYLGHEQHHPDKYVIGVRSDVSAAFAQLVVVPARNVVPLPQTMPISLGALVEPLAVAVHATRRAMPRPGDRALVLGGGPIGQSVVLALRMSGVDTIVASEPSASRRNLLETLGARTFDPGAGDATEQARAALGGAADVAIDAVGVDDSMAVALSGTKPGGLVCLVGMGSPRLGLDAFQLSTEERTVVGSYTYSNADFDDAATWMGANSQEAAALISAEVGLYEAAAAFRALADGRGPAGKVLVRLDCDTVDAGGRS